jgi:hypothetical protein
MFDLIQSARGYSKRLTPEPAALVFLDDLQWNRDEFRAGLNGDSDPTP